MRTEVTRERSKRRMAWRIAFHVPPFLWRSNTSSLGNVAVVAPRDGRVIVASYRTTTASTCTTIESIDAIHVHDDVFLSSWSVSSTSFSISRIGARSDAAMHRVRRRHALAFAVVTSWGPIPPVHESLHVKCSFDSCHTSRSHDAGVVSSPCADADAFVQHSWKTMQAARVKPTLPTVAVERRSARNADAIRLQKPTRPRSATSIQRSTCTSTSSLLRFIRRRSVRDDDVHADVARRALRS